MLQGTKSKINNKSKEQRVTASNLYQTVHLLFKENVTVDPTIRQLHQSPTVYVTRHPAQLWFKIF